MSTVVVDTHAHLCSEDFALDRAQVLAAAEAAGVKWILNVANDLASSCDVGECAEREPMTYASVGVHPHAAGSWNDDMGAELCQLMSSSRVVAVGEIGLDYHYDFSPRETQQVAFRAQLSLARSHDMPVVIHNRSADQDMMGILAEMSPTLGVLHCFWSGPKMAAQALEMGLFLGVGGAITFSSAGDLRTTIRGVPLERLLLETDAPYLAPVPFRGRRNEPALITRVAQVLAELHGRSVEYIAHQTTENAERLFMGRQKGCDNSDA